MAKGFRIYQQHIYHMHIQGDNFQMNTIIPNFELDNLVCLDF